MSALDGQAVDTLLLELGAGLLSGSGILEPAEPDALDLAALAVRRNLALQTMSNLIHCGA